MKQNFVSVPVTLGADIADGGSFAVPYPAGYNVGDFSQAKGHYLSLGGDRLLQPQHITLSFGASSVTVTNGTGGVLPAGKKGFFQFEIRGVEAGVSVLTPNGQRKLLGGTALFGLFVDFGAAPAADDNGLWDAVSAGATASTGDVSTMAAAANGGVVTHPFGVNLTVKGGGGGANQVVTFNGFDYLDQPMSETITASGANTIQGLKAFKTVTDYAIAAGGAASQTLYFGWGSKLGLPVRVAAGDIIAELENGTVIGTPKDDAFAPFDINATKYNAGTSVYTIAPVSGTILGITTVVEEATTGVGTITAELATVAVDGLTVTVADGSAVGDIDTDAATVGHATAAVTKGQAIEIVSTNTPTAGAVRGFVQIRPNTTVNGTLVAGLDKNTKATATNADVRGTYTPTTTLDGSTTFALMLLLSEVEDVGNFQYAA